jgi:hypothetical protein
VWLQRSAKTRLRPRSQPRHRSGWETPCTITFTVTITIKTTAIITIAITITITITNTITITITITITQVGLGDAYISTEDFPADWEEAIK